MNTNHDFAPHCPTCDILVAEEKSKKYLPFCSNRCRLIDLGRWLNEEHALPCDSDEESDEAEERTSSTPQLPPGWHDA